MSWAWRVLLLLLLWKVLWECAERLFKPVEEEFPDVVFEIPEASWKEVEDAFNALFEQF